MSITLHQLTKRYQGVPVVNDVSLEIGDGELFVLLGPSGSGQSTLLRTIAGLSGLDHGRIALNGRDVTHVSARRRGVGLVFQNYALFRHVLPECRGAAAARSVGAARGIPVAYTRLGVVLAMTLIGMPFAVRTVRPGRLVRHPADHQPVAGLGKRADGPEGSVMAAGAHSGALEELDTRPGCETLVSAPVRRCLIGLSAAFLAALLLAPLAVVFSAGSPPLTDCEGGYPPRLGRCLIRRF